MKFISTFVLSVLVYFSFSQSDSISVDNNFHFINGIYLSFNEFKTNSPSIKSNEMYIPLHPKYKDRIQTGISQVDDVANLAIYAEYAANSMYVSCFDKYNVEYRVAIDSIWCVYHKSQWYIKSGSKLIPKGIWPLIELSKQWLYLNTGEISEDFLIIIEKNDEELYKDYQNRIQKFKKKRDKEAIDFYIRSQFNERNSVYIFKH